MAQISKCPEILKSNALQQAYRDQVFFDNQSQLSRKSELIKTETFLHEF
jgi:hypothetical protein